MFFYLQIFITDVLNGDLKSEAEKETLFEEAQINFKVIEEKIKSQKKSTSHNPVRFHPI